MRMQVDDLSGKEIIELIQEHVVEMHSQTPKESVHAMDLQDLRQSDVTFWSAWSDEDDLVGCGAIKRLNIYHGEIKSVRTKMVHRRKGIAQKMVQHIIEQASQEGLMRLSLETGTSKEFAPARALYSAFGFQYCQPFGQYQDDPNSVFMTLSLTD